MSSTLGQRKIHSLFEAVINTAVGFILSMLIWLYVCAPLFGYVQNVSDAFLITGIFTATSVARSYACRRVFNWHQHERGTQHE